MNIHLDPTSPVPIYLQIVDQVRRLIALGALRPGDRLPPVRDLAAQIRINRNTAGRAIQELEREGVVRTQVGLGTFVAEEPPAADLAEGDQAVDTQCDRLIVEARARQVPLEQLPSRLWRRIDVFRRESAGQSPAGSTSTASVGSDDGSSPEPESASRAHASRESTNVPRIESREDSSGAPKDAVAEEDV